MSELSIAYADLTTGNWVDSKTGTIFTIDGPPPSRDSLTFGQYQPIWDVDPDFRTVGIIGDYEDLDEYNAPGTVSVTIPAGVTIENKIIYGDITHEGAMEGYNCWLWGGSNTLPSGNLGILRCINNRSGIAKWYDTTLCPTVESNGRDCALGWQYELHRCHLYGGVDGAGIYKTSSPYNCYVKIYGCLIEDLTYFYPDNITTSHSDGTHNDLIQIQGGLEIDIWGNSLWGTSHKKTGTGTHGDTEWLFTDPGGPWNNGACIIIQKNISAAPNFNTTVKIRENFYRGGKAQMLIKSTANGFEYYGNKHSMVYPPASNSSPPPTFNQYPIRMDNIASSNNIPGLIAAGAVSNTTNVFLDGPNEGVPLTTPRSAGISPSG